MSQLSTFFPLNPGPLSNVTFGSIQNTPIGSTTPAAGTFTTLAANNGTLTASAPVLDLAQTWNDQAVFVANTSGGTMTVTSIISGVIKVGQEIAAGDLIGTVITGLGTGVGGTGTYLINSTSTRTNITFTTKQRFSLAEINAVDTNSGEYSTLANFKVGGASRFRVLKSGDLVLSSQGGSTPARLYYGEGNVEFRIASYSPDLKQLTDQLRVINGNLYMPVGFGIGNNSVTGVDVLLARDAAGTLAQRNGTNAQTFNIYNTFTSTTNHERGFLRWSSNVLQIGTEKAGTGSARALELQADGQTKIIIAATGHLTLRSTDPNNGHITNSDANTWRFDANGLTLRFGRDYGRAQSFFSADEFVFGTYSNVSISQTGQVVLTRDADNTLAQRNGANGQTFRIYNTVSGTNNVNFERANFRWASSEFIIDAEFGGTGTALRGIKIGSATSSLLGFYGATPVDRPNDVVMSWSNDGSMGDVNNAEDLEARVALYEIRARLRELGLMATT
jgi:hypothetical protein